jgi:hypothetical protein
MQLHHATQVRCLHRSAAGAAHPALPALLLLLLLLLLRLTDCAAGEYREAGSRTATTSTCMATKGQRKV